MSHSPLMGSYSHLMRSSFSPYGAPFSSHGSTHREKIYLTGLCYEHPLVLPQVMQR